MYIKTSHVLILFFQIINTLANSKNATGDVKSKRGIYQISDGVDYSVIPVHHFNRPQQITDASQVDITYKPYEEKAHIENYHAQYEHPDPLKVAANNQQHHYKVHEPSFSAQQHIPSYAPSQYHQYIPTAKATNDHHLTVPHQHLVAPQYQLPLQSRYPAPLTLYGSDKQITLPANLRTNSEIKLPEYTNTYNSIPIIYGQSTGNLPSLKYIQPIAKPQFNIAPTYSTLLANNQFNQLRQLPNKYQAQPLHIHRPQNYKAVHPNFFQPQVFDNPVVPQLQHYIPQIQSPFDAFTKPVTSAPITVAKQAPPKQERPASNDDDDDKEDEGKHEHREEIKGEVIHQEINDEEDFDKGYDDASRGFHTYKDDDDEDYVRPRYRNYDDDSGKYNKYRSHHDDHDDDYEDDRHGRYSERDHEGHYSQKHKKESREKYRPSKSKQESNSAKYRDEERPSSKRPQQSNKYHKSNNAPRKSSDLRHGSTSLKKQISKKNQKESASSRSEVEFKPNYQYGFEPIKTPYAAESKERELDSVAKHSSPVSSKKLYKENWYISKTSKSHL